MGMSGSTFTGLPLRRPGFASQSDLFLIHVSTLTYICDVTDVIRVYVITLRD